MMNHNTRVQPEEVAMMLKAQKTERMQYFPLKFAVKNFKDAAINKRAMHRAQREQQMKKTSSK